MIGWMWLSWNQNNNFNWIHEFNASYIFILFPQFRWEKQNFIRKNTICIEIQSFHFIFMSDKKWPNRKRCNNREYGQTIANRYKSSYTNVLMCCWCYCCGCCCISKQQEMNNISLESVSLDQTLHLAHKWIDRKNYFVFACGRDFFRADFSRETEFETSKNETPAKSQSTRCKRTIMEAPFSWNNKNDNIFTPYQTYWKRIAVCMNPEICTVYVVNDELTCVLCV